MNDESAAHAMAAAIAAAALIAENACPTATSSILVGPETAVASPMMIDEPTLTMERDPSPLGSHFQNDSNDTDIHRHRSLLLESNLSKNCFTEHRESLCTSELDELGQQQQQLQQLQQLQGQSNGNEDDDDEDDDDDNAEKRIARSRERNREHARRTRLRKKAQIKHLKTEVQDLEAENKHLKQSIEECNIASILLGISTGDIAKSADHHNDGEAIESDEIPSTTPSFRGKQRMRSISEDDGEKSIQPIKLTLDGHTHLVGGGKTHINWKSGVYCDENGARKILSKRQLEALRRERNRMHAKMTRDRKKSFVATILKTIDELADENKRMRQVLARVAKNHFGNRLGPNAITPHSSPQFAGAQQSNDLKTPDIQNSMSCPAMVDSY